MGRTYEEVMASLSPERRARIEQQANILVYEYRLAEIRNKAGYTQADMSHSLNVHQVAVSQIEKRKDMKISTLRNYIAAIGGNLKLIAEFPDEEPIIIGLDTESNQALRRQPAP
jgi:DNA-binding XRE family transcriptional regulator